MKDYLKNSPAPAEVRFWRFVDKSGAGCWLWTGAINRGGYGVFQKGSRKPVSAHRFGFELQGGTVLPGQPLDHLCRTKRCVRGDHLEPVTPRENTLRCPEAPATKNLAKTHCPAGHEYDEANVYLWRGHRNCRACARVAQQRWRLRRRGVSG